MKMSNYILLFFSICVAFYLPMNHYGMSVVEIGKEQLRYNRNLDNAVEDGLFQLVEKDSSKEIVLNKEKAEENFYQSLYCNFGIPTNRFQQERMKQCVPLLLITDKDGFYINVSRLKKNKNGVQVIEKCWSKKKPYLYTDRDYIYEFTLSNEIKLYNKKKELLIEGDYHDFAGKYPKSKILNRPAIFEEIRRKCIIGHLKEAMEDGLRLHNSVAKMLGVSYQFFFPTVAKEDWYRTIDDVSMLVIFQGYPWRSGNGYFNRYAIGGARIWKHSAYYVSLGENRKLYYHKEKCSKRGRRELKYSTKQECALNGAYPCEICRP